MSALLRSSSRVLGRRLFGNQPRPALLPAGGTMVKADVSVINNSFQNKSATFRRSLVMVSQQKAGEKPLANPSAATATSDKSSSPDTQQPSSATAPAADGNDNQALQITESCWKRIRKLTADKQDDSLFLRVFVDAGGCSGFQYQFELDSQLEDDDVVFLAPEHEDDGARVVVDENSLGFIRGSTIDYVQEMIKSSFEVRNNPLSESACGCGSSFALKNFASNPALD